MRLRDFAGALAALPLLFGGCGSATPSAAPSATATPGAPWVVVATGSATPTAFPSGGGTGTSRPALPKVSFLPTSSACAVAWPENEKVLIPMIVTPGKGSLKVQWPARYGPDYRVAAVPQTIVTGSQPPPTWQTVRAGNGCTATATITGLTSGAAYIVWLDAPNTPHRLDGSRSLYSGKSGVVKPL